MASEEDNKSNGDICWFRDSKRVRDLVAKTAPGAIKNSYKLHKDFLNGDIGEDKLIRFRFFLTRRYEKVKIHHVKNKSLAAVKGRRECREIFLTSDELDQVVEVFVNILPNLATKLHSALANLWSQVGFLTDYKVFKKEISNKQNSYRCVIDFYAIGDDIILTNENYNFYLNTIGEDLDETARSTGILGGSLYVKALSRS